MAGPVVGPGGRGGAGADFLQLDAAAAPRGNLAGWLAEEVRTAVGDGRLQPGTVLPPSRTLARDLGLSRGVVVQAYQRLTDEGLVLARQGAQTVVAPPVAAPLAPAPPAPAPLRPAPPGPSAPAVPAPPGPAGPRRPGGSSVPRLPSAAPDVALDLSPGVPDLSAFPREEWLRAERAVLASAGPTDLGYGDPQGSARLREQLVGWLARTRGLRVGPGDVVVVSGVAQSITLMTLVLQRRGLRALAVEDPGSRGAREAVEHGGLATVAVPVDEEGLRVPELRRSGAGAVMLTPAHQFPTGVVLAPARRRELLEWAVAADGVVLEDDYDAEHRYDRAPVPALHASAPGHVAHMGSTSKSLAPGMRLGWLVPPRRLLEDVVAAKHAADLGSPALPQLVLAHLLDTGRYDRHLRAVRTRQRARRDAVLQALQDHLPEARVEGVAAGLHLLLTFPGGPGVPGAGDDAQLSERARRAGVFVQPLSWHRVRPGPAGLVLGYAAHPPDRLREAVRRLGAALRAGGGT